MDKGERYLSYSVQKKWKLGPEREPKTLSGQARTKTEVYSREAEKERVSERVRDQGEFELK